MVFIDQRVKEIYLQKENPNNYLGYSNNNLGNLLAQYPNYSNNKKYDIGELIDEINFRQYPI